MKKSIAFAILGLLLVVAVLGGMKALQIKDLIAAGSAAKQPPIAVTTVTVAATDWETSINALGTLEAAQGVVITADLPGRVSALYFDGGETVKAGKLLLEQENSSENAQLSAAESDLELAQRNLDRVARLFRSKVISRSEFDTARSQESAAQAQVDNITTSLDKKQITAPFDGRLGLRLVDIGQDLSQGLPIVSLQAIDPMLVNFSLPQQALANVKEGFKVRVATDASPGVVFDGSITAINTEIDTSTRTVRTQATLNVSKDEQGNEPNLLPGMFATVEVVLPEPRPVLMIPLTAVNFATFGDSVFLIEESENDELVARQQFVQLGERRGDYVEIKKGLQQGQTLANDGTFKLRNGAMVIIQESGTEPNLTPKPDNA